MTPLHDVARRRVAPSRVFAPLSVAVFLAACRAPSEEADVRIVRLPPASVVATVGGVSILMGGQGSGASVDPRDPSRVYLMTDRGPNYEQSDDVKAFPEPRFAPRVSIVRVTDTAADVVPLQILPLANEQGVALSGLPHPPGAGATGEAAVSPAGARIEADPVGIDPEAIHVLRDGSFWVAEEYGPALLRFDSAGRLLRRVEPAGTQAGGLPRVLASRRPNRGFEALTGDPDGAVLIAIPQSPLDNPRDAGRASRSVRLVLFEPDTDRSRQLVYELDRPEHVISDAAWLAPDTLLLLEHDTRFPGGSPASTHQAVYRAILSGATDVSDPVDEPGGRRFEGRTLEELSSADLARAGVRPVARRLVVDLRALGYPHDKPEGLVVLDSMTLGIVNDDDFGVTDGPRGGIVQKQLPATGERDRSELWIVRLPRAIR
jgi:hypothetical protein